MFSLPVQQANKYLCFASLTAIGVIMGHTSHDQFGLVTSNGAKDAILQSFASKTLMNLERSQSAIPELAKNTAEINEIERLLPTLPTCHRMHRTDARELDFLPSESVHLGPVRKRHLVRPIPWASVMAEKFHLPACPAWHDPQSTRSFQQQSAVLSVLSVSVESNRFCCEVAASLPIC